MSGVILKFLDSEGKENTAVFLLLAVFILMLGSAYLYVNSIDEGVYLLISKEMIGGKVPYKDIAENKPPGLYLLLVPAVLFAGKSLPMLRLYGYLFVLLTSYLIFLTGKRVENGKVGLFAGIVYILFIFDPLSGAFGLMTEPIANLFIVAGIFLLLHKKTATHWFLIGLATAVACSTKQTAVFLFIPVIYSFIKENEGLNWKKNALAFCAGVVLITLPQFLYLAYNGALYDAFYYMFLLPIRLGGSTVLVKLYLFSMVSVLLFPVVLLAGIGCLKTDKFKLNLLLSWLLGAFLLIQFGYSDQRHYVFLIPPLSILAGIGLVRLFSLRAADAKGKGIVISAFLVIVILLFLIQILLLLSRISAVRSSGEEYNTIYYPDIMAVSSFIKNNTAPGEKILCFRNCVDVYYFSDRDSILKVPFLFGDWFRRMDEQELRQYLLDPVELQSPRYVIVNRLDVELTRKTVGKNLVTFEGFMNESYEFNQSIGMYDVYMRRKLNS